MIIYSLLLLFGFCQNCSAQKSFIPAPPLVTDQPYFDPSMDKTVITHVNKTVNLYCRVHSIGNRTVSWIRSSDIQILTVHRYTYTTDLRHEALHEDGTNQWTLRIRNAQKNDSGNYECQISAKPIKTFYIKLVVLEPRVEVLGAPDLFVHRASMINLTCVMHDVPEPPTAVRWLHDNKLVTHSSRRGGISHVVEKGATTVSYLLIQEATDADSGLYTCLPDNMPTKNITVHVKNGESRAAMQANNSVGIFPPRSSAFVCFVVCNTVVSISLQIIWFSWVRFT